MNPNADIGRRGAIAREPAPVMTRMRRRHCELPVIPSVATTLISLLARDEVGLAEVSAAVAADAAIAAEVLRSANSAYYGIRGEVTSLQHAATLLGLDRIRAMAATIGLRRYLGATLAAPAVARCWRHNVAVAVAAEQLAVRCGGHGGDAYTAGLLHDLGRLALIVAHPKAYPDFLETTRATGEPLLAEERDLFDIDHAEAGRWMTQQLLLPQIFQDVTQHHHDPRAVGPTELLVRVGVACRLADHLGYWVIHPTDVEADVAAVADAAGTLDALLLPLPAADRALIASDMVELRGAVDQQVQALDEVLAT